MCWLGIIPKDGSFFIVQRKEKTLDHNEKSRIADNISILDYCQAIGFELVYKNHQYKHPGWNGLTISEDGNAFYNFSPDSTGIVKGRSILFVQWYNMVRNDGDPKVLSVEEAKVLSVEEALDELLMSQGYDIGEHDFHSQKPKTIQKKKNYPDKPKKKSATKKAFILPKPNQRNNRVFAYLSKTRKIDTQLIQNCLKNHLLYESADNHNCVFVCYDNNNKPESVFMRGTYTKTDTPFKGNLGVENHGWIMQKGDTNCLRLFESPIDILSKMTLLKNYLPDKYEELKNDTWFSMNGLKHHKVIKFLEDNPQYTKIVFCTDNDPIDKNGISKGNQFCFDCKKTIEEYFPGRCSFFRDKPKMKDWNEDLCYLKEKEEYQFKERESVIQRDYESER